MTLPVTTIHLARCSLSESGWGKIDLLDHGQAPASSAVRITAGLARKLEVSSVAQGKGKTGAPSDPCADLVVREAAALL
jgi:hypothetical protein